MCSRSFLRAFQCRCSVVIVAGLLGVIAFILSSCNPTPRQRYERQLLDTAKPALHGVHSDRLQRIMMDLNHLTFAEMPQEMDSGTGRDEYIRHASEVSALMATAAGNIPDILNGVRLSEEDRRVFIKLADKLKDEAMEFSRLAQHSKDIRQMEVTLDKITATCNACHTAFRVLPTVTASTR